MSGMPRYADLEVRILARRGSVYPVEMTLDSEQEYGPGSLSTSGLPWVPSADLAADGRRLFEWLFADGKLRAAWSEIRGQHPQRRVRLRLASAAPELHTVPWELLSDVDSATVQSLAAAEATPFSRYTAGKWHQGAAIVKRPLRALVVIANPMGLEEYDLQPVAVENEAALLREATADLDVELTFLPPPCTLRAIERALRDGGHHVLHLFAHGAFSRQLQSAALFLADGDGRVELVVDEDFAAMLARQLADIDTQRQDKLRLVFLASCQTATRSPADAFRGFAPRLVAAGVPAVIAMQDRVAVVTAREFAETFYRRLLTHGQVDLAGNEARSAILTSNLPGAAIPVLFQRLRSGLLLGQPSTDAEEVLDEFGSGPYRLLPSSEPSAETIVVKTQAEEDLEQEVLHLLGQSSTVPEEILDEAESVPYRLSPNSEPLGTQIGARADADEELKSEVQEGSAESATFTSPRRLTGLAMALGVSVVLAIAFYSFDSREESVGPSPPSSGPSGPSLSGPTSGDSDPVLPLPLSGSGPETDLKSPTNEQDSSQLPTVSDPETDPKLTSDEPDSSTSPSVSDPETDPKLPSDGSESTSTSTGVEEPPPIVPRTIAVLPLGLALNDDEVHRYLASHLVGKNVHDQFVGHLYDKGTLKLVHIKTLTEDLIDQRWASMKGVVARQEAISYGKRMGAQYVACGEVKSFSAKKLGRRHWEIKVELQVRMDSQEEQPSVFFDKRVAIGCRVSFKDEKEAVGRYAQYLSDEALRLAVCDLVKHFPGMAKAGALNDCLTVVPEGNSCELR